MKRALISILLVSLLVAQAAPGLRVSNFQEAPGTSTTGTSTATTTIASGSEAVAAVNRGIDAQENKWLDDAFFQNGFCSPAAGQLGNFDPFVPAAMMLAVIAIAVTLVYLMGSVFDSPMLHALAKQEGYEILLTILVFVGFFAVSGLLNNAVLGAHAGDAGMMGRAADYSKVMVIKISKDVGSLALFNTFLYMFYSAPIKFGKAAYAGVSFNMGAVLRPFIDGIGVASNLLSVALGEWLANLGLLCFIKRVAVPVMLPIGLLLRSVPQLRGGGNALIAFAFALFIVYPAMLSFNYEAYLMRYGSTTQGLPIQNAVAYFISQFGLLGGAALLLGVKVITGTGLGAILIVSGAMVFLETIADMVYTVFVMSFFLALLNIFITLTFAKELAKFLGTEINVGAFVRLL
ncbi:MAG: hypothetical protein PHQ80_04590 [Candidatus ainarchaeum sp.]|nr:hypothetical protein [Candidatus ainarchaeum sp.]MDD5096658.1 hypothetical protein [Candidatus ainarchaeum sp.]